PAASSTTYTTTTLSWLSSTGGDYATAFYTVNEDGNQIMQLPGNVLTATVTGMNPGSSHSFVMYAYDTAGNKSTASTTVNVTTSTIPSPGTTVSSSGSETYTTSNATLSAHVYEPFSFVRVFIDSDNNTSTGYTYSGIGADYMIENGRLFSMAT